MQIQSTFVLEFATGGVFVSAVVNGIAAFMSHSKTRWLMREYRLHAHVEEKGQLSAEGIRYPRTNGTK